MESEKTSFQLLFEFMEGRISYHIVQVNKELLRKDIKEEDVVLYLLDRKNKLVWPIRIVHEALKARTPGEREPRVRLVW